MLNPIVEWSLRNRLVVLLCFALVVAFGAMRLAQLPVDAFPDTTPVQVQINTSAPALNPAEIEREITLPMELAVSGLPGLREVRSVSKFGFSQVVATFDDNTTVYDARQFVMERLATVDLADEIEAPQLGPIATGLGEVFHYILQSEDPNRSLSDLRELHDWVIKPELLKVPGVAEINSWGGHEKEFHVIADPAALINYGLTLAQLEEAIVRNNQNAAGGQIQRAGEALLVHGLGRVASTTEIEEIVIAAFDGAPVYVRDVAEVRVDHEIRQGAVSFQGRGEAVLGLGFMLMGENSRDVAAALRQRLEAAAEALPDDVKIDVVYDRTDLVDEVMGTVRHNLYLGAILVVVTLFVLLGNVRAGILVAVTIPLAMLCAVLGMYELSIAASLLSLGAIDFGILVDGSVVMTEANLRRLRERQAALARPLRPQERLQAIVDSSREVIRPIVFGMGIILIVFVPVLALEDVEGKMFRPMAATFIFALVGALVIAATLSPVLSYYALPRNARPERAGPVTALVWCYERVLRVALKARWLILAATICVMLAAGIAAARLGGEFLPRLGEGAVVANVVRLAGVAIPTSVRYNSRIEQLLLDHFPDEIEFVWSRIGTAEVATDPMGTELTDIFLKLHPRAHWTRATNQEELVAAIESEFDDLPGVNIAYTQPIEMRMNELISGIRSDVGIKIYGDDFEDLLRISNDIQRVLLTIQGASEISADQLTGQPTLQIDVDRLRVARHGIPAAEVLDFVRAVGGIEVGEVYEGQRVFPLVLRLPDTLRVDPERLAATRIPTAFGPQLELRQLATISEIDAPSTINREWSRRMMRVQVNVRGRDVASFVDDAQRRIAKEVAVPEGYHIDWGGQFENLQRARLRLAVLVPITLSLIFILLYFSLKNLRDALIIYSGVPFAAIGGVAALWWRDIPFSVSAAVGFIALAGIAVLNGQVLIVAVRYHRQQGAALGNAIVEGARQRLRPVLATAITDAAGFVPMALSTGVGAEVQRPLATVVIGGVITNTVLTLIVLPVLYRTVYRDSPEQGSSPTSLDTPAA